jgi:hypothetical protein
LEAAVPSDSTPPTDNGPAAKPAATTPQPATTTTPAVAAPQPAVTTSKPAAVITTPAAAVPQPAATTTNTKPAAAIAPPAVAAPQPAEKQQVSIVGTGQRPSQTGFGPPASPPLQGPWPATTLWGHRWPGPGRPASPATVVALLTAALVAAVSIPLDRGGAGWLVTALAATAALVVARMVPHRQPTSVPMPLLHGPARRESPVRFGWATATVALLSVGTVRSADWLVVLCLATALLTGALAVAGGGTVRAMVTAVQMASVSGFRAIPWFSRGLGALRRRTPGGNEGVRIAATVAVSVALLVVFGTLFASADAAFADVLSRVLPDIDGGTVARWIFVFAVTLGLLGGAAFLRAAPPQLSDLDYQGERKVGRLEWAIPLALLTLLFGLFVAVQLAVLFGGSRHVLATDGLTYADYARGGFWQLLVVTGLTLVVLAGAVRWAPRTMRTDRVFIRTILGTLAGLTLIIVASALHRMDVYADTYGLTRLRVLVALCEFWLGVVFLMVLIAGVRLRAVWLPRAVVGTGVLALLGLAAANPDGLIADRNVTRYEQINRIDTAYLATLSADAVPALDRLGTLAPEKRDCVLMDIADDLAGNPDDWRGWSYGRAHAREMLRVNPVVRNANCS